jgi:hypothetical protein
MASNRAQSVCDVFKLSFSLMFGGGEVEEAVDVLVEFGFQADDGLGGLLVLGAAQQFTEQGG